MSITTGDTFDFGRYLASLPRREIRPVAATTAPKFGAIGTLADYNGFTGKERLRTFEIAKWLSAEAAMPHSGICSICSGAGDQQHAEDYFDLTTWMDICRGCHISLHGRLRTPQAWRRRLDRLRVPPDHWARRLPDTSIDVAGHHRLNGRVEPKASDYIIDLG